jgi:hypothetical protein
MAAQLDGWGAPYISTQMILGDSALLCKQRLGAQRSPGVRFAKIFTFISIDYRYFLK